MNKHAYLIMVHKNIEQVQRLINILDKDYNDIYVHVDKKYKYKKDFKCLITKHSKLYVFSCIDVKWGDYSVVECEMLLLKEAIKKGYSYYHLLSGEDFPIKKIDNIYNFFENSKKEFVFFSNKQIKNKDMDRVLYKHVMLGKLRSSKKSFVNKIYFKIDNFFVFMEKILKIRKKLYFDNYQRGSQWFSITYDFAKYVCSKEKEIEKAFKDTLIPDEMFLQTIIINSKWKNNIYKLNEYNKSIQNVRYIDWTRGNPYIFKEEDFDELVNSECYFARKFSSHIDSKIISKLENFINDV